MVLVQKLVNVWALLVRYSLFGTTHPINQDLGETLQGFSKHASKKSYATKPSIRVIKLANLTYSESQDQCESEHFKEIGKTWCNSLL